MLLLMPKRFKIKGSGRIVEYEKDANTGGYRVKGDIGGCSVGKKADKGGCSVGKKKTTDPKSSLPAIPRAKTNPEIFKRLGIEDMAIPDWAYDRNDPEPEEYKVPAYEDPRDSRVEEEGDIRMYRRDLYSGDFTHYDKQTGKWIPSNDPDAIYYEGGGYGYNEFDSEERDGFEHISVNTYGEDDRSHFQFTKDNISRKKRILPEEHMPKKKKKEVEEMDYHFWHEDAEAIHRETGKIPKTNPYENDDGRDDLVWYDPNDEESGMRFKKSKKHDTPYYVRLADGHITYNSKNKRHKFHYYQ